MTNNAVIFFEQQKKAFYEFDFENFSMDDLERMVGKYKADKESAEFPPPDCIFSKKFRFLPDTLEIMQIKSKFEKEALIKEAMNNSRKTEVKPKSTTKKTDKIITQKSVSDTKSFPKRKTKLGVVLENKSDTDSDNSFITPSAFNYIITNMLSGKKPNNEKELEILIETSPITKHELKKFETQPELVFTTSDCESEEKKFSNELKTIGHSSKKSHSPVLCYVKIGLDNCSKK